MTPKERGSMREEPALPPWCRIDRDLRITKIQLRDAPDAAQRLAALLGVAAPAPCRFALTDTHMLAAKAPGEWLLLSSDANAELTASGIEAALCGETALMLDVTPGVIALRLTGASATACLAAYTALDLREAAMPTGSAVRTRFGEIGVFVARTSDAPDYLLIADQSYAPYLLTLIVRSELHTHR
jgi:sarcosine oxidase subunit gamma